MKQILTDTCDIRSWAAIGWRQVGAIGPGASAVALLL